MTRLSIPLATLLLLLLAGWQVNKTLNIETHYILTDESTLWVTGTSTVHDWKCDVENIDGWIDAEIGEGMTSLSKAEITIQADGLDCKNGTMDKKTRKALDAGKAPIIRYQLTAAKISPGTGQTLSANTTGALSIAGQTRTVTATVKGQVMKNGEARFSGTLPITMSDYGIDPPTALLGTLKTGDEVTVHFEIVAAPVSNL